MTKDFSEVFNCELQAIAKRRETLNVPGFDDCSPDEPDSRRGLVGLALSGGGIRSATFALGVLQVLAKTGVLRRVDYLSTVSGGGYIGTSLRWFSQRSMSFPFGTRDPGDAVPASPTEQDKNLHFLRSHGNFLTPGNGITIFSAVVVLLRGLVANALALGPLLLFISLVLKRLEESRPGHAASNLNVYDYVGLTVAGLVLAAFFAYSVLTRLPGGFLGQRTRYCLRRCYEAYLPKLLFLGAVAAVISLSFKLSNHVTTVAPSALLSGLMAALIAVIPALSANASKVPIVPAAALASTLLGFGLLVASHSIVDLMVDCKMPFPALAITLFTVLGLMFGWFSNVNYLSLHRYYRDRLMETFLPDAGSIAAQSNEAANGADSAPLKYCEKVDAGSPYHLINTNAVLVDSDSARVRMRGGDSFLLSPHYCGSHALGWYPIDTIEPQMRLATAMAISGAAVNPHTAGGDVTLMRSRPVSILMNLLNLRMGYWIRHPRRAEAATSILKAETPSLLVAIYYSIRRRHREDSNFLELTDGGHFENLGLYELIRRKVKYIIVSDGGQDQGYDFVDFQVALRRIAEDFGVWVEFDQDNHLDELVPDADPAVRFPSSDPKISKRGFVRGTIKYGEGMEDGVLLYLKPVILKSFGLRTKGYKGANTSFPNQSTADQFFDEAQFDAYREVGYRVAESAFYAGAMKGF